MPKLTGYALLSVLILLLVLPTIAFAGDPVGSSPANPLPVTDLPYEMPANGKLWFAWPYYKRTQLAIKVKVEGTEEIGMAVYTTQQARVLYTELDRGPIGRGAFNRNEPEYALTWEGHMQQDETLFLLLTNPSPSDAVIRFGYSYYILPDIWEIFLERLFRSLMQ